MNRLVNVKLQRTFISVYKPINKAASLSTTQVVDAFFILPFKCTVCASRLTGIAPIKNILSGLHIQENVSMFIQQRCQ